MELRIRVTVMEPSYTTLYKAGLRGRRRGRGVWTEVTRWEDKRADRRQVKIYVKTSAEEWRHTHTQKK